MKPHQNNQPGNSEKETAHEISKMITERQIGLSEEDIMQRKAWDFQGVMLRRKVQFYFTPEKSEA